MTLPVRLRRLRKNAEVRRLFQESTVELRNLVMPYFVMPGSGTQKETTPGSGLWQLTPDKLVEEVKPLVDAGVGGVMLFGVPEHKHDDGHHQDVQLRPLIEATTALKRAHPELVLFADVCLCSFTTHGHCGLVKDGKVHNDSTLPVLASMAVHLGGAGIDFVAPSDMMDGRIGALRSALDEAHLEDTGILSYAVKMASAFYGPFRLAADSAPRLTGLLSDRKTYQMPASNRREARREWQLDVDEGADALLVKPALTNLDIIRDIREESDLPIFAYQVSGERAMLQAAASQGLLDYERALEETLLSMRRAGADVIVTYEARPRALRSLGR